MKAIFAITIFLTVSLHASEIDSFTNRYKDLKDADEVIIKKSNDLFRQAVKKSNRNKSCSKQQLYRSIKRYFKNHYVDKFTKWLVKSPEIPKRIVKFSDSIYQDLKVKDSIVIGGLGKIVDSSGPIIKINNIIIGQDKFEHFFGRGNVYFFKYFYQNQSLSQVLNYGIQTEMGFLGSSTTGVMSYGDLAANFKGMLFWNHILKEFNDPIKTEVSNLGPYVECIDNKWVQVKNIDLSKYVDSSWDESINCSKFRTQNIVEKVKSRINEMEREDKNNYKYSCPVDPKKLKDIENKYSEISKWIINSSGHDVIVR